MSQMGTNLMTSSATTLPEGYQASSRLDLKEDRTAATTIQVGFGAAVAALVALIFLLDLPMASGWPGWVVAAVTALAAVAYMVVHELTHGAALLALTGVRPTFGVRLPYLFTGSPALLTRRQMVVAALAPLVLWGAVLLSLMAVLPQDAFLTLYVVAVLNVAGSAGDVLQAWVVGRLPESALVRDDGYETTVFLPAQRPPA